MKKAPKTIFPLILAGVLHIAVLVCALAPVMSHAQITSYLVGIVNKRAYINEPIRVVWLAPQGRTEKKAWVGIYPVGATDREYVAWEYIHPTNEFGYLTFTLAKTGRFEVRLFSEGYTKVASGGGLIVSIDDGPGSFSSTYDIAVKQRTIDLGEDIEVSWRVPLEKLGVLHWIGLYKRNAKANQYVDWEGISTREALRGTITLQPPESGVYEVRLFAGSGYQSVATSSRITVASTVTPSTYSLRFDGTSISKGDSVTLLWERRGRSGASRDWVGIYRSGSGDQSYTSWKYLPRGDKGELTFILSNVGTYEARLFLDDGYTKAATSNNRVTVRE